MTNPSPQGARQDPVTETPGEVERETLDGLRHLSANFHKWIKDDLADAFDALLAAREADNG